MMNGMVGTQSRVCGVILAAGLASRFGQNKLLQPLKGRPLYRYALDAALESRLSQVVMICGPELAQAAARHDGLICRVNPEPQAGQAGSLKIGLKGLEPECSHVLFMLGDQPLITKDLLNRFCFLAGQGTQMACLGWGDYLGPPALFGRSFFAELQNLSGDQGAGGLLRLHRQQLKVVEAASHFLTWDVDRPGDLQRMEKLLRSKDSPL